MSFMCFFFYFNYTLTSCRLLIFVFSPIFKSYVFKSFLTCIVYYESLHTTQRRYIRIFVGRERASGSVMGVLVVCVPSIYDILGRSGVKSSCIGRTSEIY